MVKYVDSEKWIELCLHSNVLYTHIFALLGAIYSNTAITQFLTDLI